MASANFRGKASLQNGCNHAFQPHFCFCHGAILWDQVCSQVEVTRSFLLSVPTVLVYKSPRLALNSLPGYLPRASSLEVGGAHVAMQYPESELTSYLWHAKHIFRLMCYPSSTPFRGLQAPLEVGFTDYLTPNFLLQTEFPTGVKVLQVLVGSLAPSPT